MSNNPWTKQAEARWAAKTDALRVISFPQETSQEIKIEDNIPIPTIHQNGQHKERIDIIIQLQPGQSALFPLGYMSSLLTLQAVLGKAAKAVCRVTSENRQYTTRRTEGGVRIWRVV